MSAVQLFNFYLITKTSSDQFRKWSFAKIFLYFHILTTSLIYLLESMYMLGLTSRGFALTVLWYVSLYLLTISSNLPRYRIF